jgi:hypothetical protein
MHASYGRHALTAGDKPRIFLRRAELNNCNIEVISTLYICTLKILKEALVRLHRLGSVRRGVGGPPTPPLTPSLLTLRSESYHTHSLLFYWLYFSLKINYRTISIRKQMCFHAPTVTRGRR